MSEETTCAFCGKSGHTHSETVCCINLKNDLKKANADIAQLKAENAELKNRLKAFSGPTGVTGSIGTIRKGR